MENYDKTPQNNTPAVSPGLAGFLGLIVVFALNVFGGLVISLLAFGGDFQTADSNVLRLVTAASQLLFMLLPALVLGRAIYFDLTKLIRAYKPKLSDIFIFIIGMGILIFLIQSYMYLQTYFIESLAESSTFFGKLKSLLDNFNVLVESSYKSILHYESILGFLLTFVTITFVPAICEEVFFRGYLQRSFELKWTPFKGALLTSVIFGLFHFNFYGLVPLIGIGFFLGFALYKTNSILVPMILHFMNNAFSFIGYVIFGEEELNLSNGIDAELFNIQLFMFVLLLIIFFFFIFFVNKHYKKSTTDIEGGNYDMP